MNQILFLIVMALIIAGLIIMYIGPSIQTIFTNRNIQGFTEDGPWNLSQHSISSKLSDPFRENQTSLFRVFYNITSMPRTSSHNISEGDGFDSTNNTYNVCEISEAQKCAHPGFTKLLSFGSSLWIEVLNAPDASRPGLPLTQLCIKTMKANKNYIETFPVPPFPIQKWTMLTLCRNGSRFDVYYNNRVVASVKTENIPYFTDTTLKLAESGVKGTACGIMSAGRYFKADDINADYSALTDSTGKPYIIDKVNFFDMTNISLCPSGDCFKGPTVRPANPLVQWTSRYN